MRETLLILHFIGLAMGVGTGFAHAFIGAAAGKMPPAEGIKFRLNSLVITRVGNIGLVLLLVSGLGLITPYWKVLPSSPLLIAKLVLVALLIIVIARLNILGRKAQQANPGEQFAKMKTLGKVSMVLALSIVVVAVLYFQ
ncbi:MAG TPA: hypothetical protein VGD65_25010 [Chryseosolibacter sp.]